MTTNVIHKMNGIVGTAPQPLPSSAFVASVAAGFTGTQATNSGFVLTVVNFDNEEIDNGWGWTAPDTDFVVPAGVSVVVISVTMYAGTGLTPNDHSIQIRLNGVSQSQEYQDNQFRNYGHSNAVLSVTPADVITIGVNTEAAITLNAGTRVTIAGYA